jgi:N-acetylneuraminate synthase/N,N'-diacetyllegionaminate synthase
MNAVAIGDRKAGPGCPALLVAEIGINHNGDMDLARRTIDAAARAGADAVKFQNYKTEDFVLDMALTYTYDGPAGPVTESQFEMFKRYELAEDQLATLKRQCDDAGVIFHSTPTSVDGIAALVRLGTAVLKNGSDYLTNLPLIRAMGATGLPTVLSTGMATLAEIGEAVEAFRGTGNHQLLLLHCTSAYPTPPGEVHLRKMVTLGRAFGCPVGLSDHTDGVTAAIGAVALGACWIEKHFTLDKALPGPDHRFSADREEFRRLVGAVREMEAQLGTGLIGPASAEDANRGSFRLSCVAARDLPADHRLAREDVAFCRPGTGLPPSAVERLIGRRLSRATPAGGLLALDVAD